MWWVFLWWDRFCHQACISLKCLLIKGNDFWNIYIYYHRWNLCLPKKDPALLKQLFKWRLNGSLVCSPLGVYWAPAVHQVLVCLPGVWPSVAHGLCPRGPAVLLERAVRWCALPGGQAAMELRLPAGGQLTEDHLTPAPSLCIARGCVCARARRISFVCLLVLNPQMHTCWASVHLAGQPAALTHCALKELLCIQGDRHTDNQPTREVNALLLVGTQGRKPVVLE